MKKSAPAKAKKQRKAAASDKGNIGFDNIVDMPLVGRKRLYESLEKSFLNDGLDDKSITGLEAVFQLLPEDFPAALWIDELHPHRPVYISPAFEFYTGMSLKDFYSDPLAVINCIHPDDRDHFLEQWNNIEEEIPMNIRYKIVRPDGTVRFIWDRSYLVRDESGSACKMIGLAVDVTDFISAEEKLLDIAKDSPNSSIGRELDNIKRLAGPGSNGEISLIAATSSNLFIDGIKQSIGSQNDINLLGEASTYEGLLDFVIEESPDVLLIDMGLESVDIKKKIEAFKKSGLETRIILYLRDHDDDFIVEAMTLGVRGFISEKSSHSQIIEAIRAVHKEEIWADSALLTRVMDNVINPRSKKIESTEVNLTRREKEIIENLVQGHSNKRIARKLDISENTVKNHLANIYSKYDVTSRTQLMSYLSHGGSTQDTNL